MCEGIESFVEEVKSYKCSYCGHLYTREMDAIECAFRHAKLRLANVMLKDGYPLSTIEYRCGFHWNLSDFQKDITKDNCFVISHWQCCGKPAYKIIEIEDEQHLKLWGKGGWNGYYGNSVYPNRLPTPHNKEDLFVYGGLT